MKKEAARKTRPICVRKPVNHAGLYIVARNEFPGSSLRFAPQAAFGQRQFYWTVFGTLVVSLLCLLLR